VHKYSWGILKRIVALFRHTGCPIPSKPSILYKISGSKTITNPKGPFPDWELEGLKEARGVESAIESLVDKAKEGDSEALEALVLSIQDRVYGLAIRMLSHPADAEDATQDILMKVVTHLGTFRQESAFSTWVYRIASNHLLTTRKRRAERLEITFDMCARQVDDGLAAQEPHSVYDAEQSVVVEELMISCMQAMLLCLDRDLRIVFILGQVFEVSGDQGAYILDITPTAYRKRLSRARKLIRDFMSAKCGLFDEDNPCRCSKQVGYAGDTRWINLNRLRFAEHPRRNYRVGVPVEELRRMDELERVEALFRSHPDYVAPPSFMENLKTLFSSVKRRMLDA
jgi:RNA polymerase sigma factor (sigma-70 family)